MPVADERPRYCSGERSRGIRAAGQRGAVALEYILISALVAIALIVAFRLWGISLFRTLANVAWDSSAALVEIIAAR